LYEKSGAIALVLPGLTAGRLAGWLTGWLAGWPASIMLENLPIMLSGISQKSSPLCPSISLLCLKFF